MKIKQLKSLGLSGVVGLSALLSACDKQDGAPKQVKAKGVNVDCPKPTGKVVEGSNPFAVPEKAVVCGEIKLWGGPFPKSLNTWKDPNSTNSKVMELLFEPLAEMHSKSDTAVGVIASSWTVSDDKMSYTFKLNPNAKWSDGKSITAEDIQFYYDVIMNKKNMTPVYRVALKRFERPKIIDELTVKITAKEAHWKNFWEATSFMAFPKHVWQGKDFNKVNFKFPVVSGPYQIKKLKKERSLLLEKRTDWWGKSRAYTAGTYNFKHIRYKFMEDRTKALEALKKGDFDIYPIYTSAIWAKQTQFDAVQKNWVIRQHIKNDEPMGFQGFAINLRQKRFQDIRVREALALLLNRKLMNDKLMYGAYFLLNSYYPDLYAGRPAVELPEDKFNTDKARALLKEAGYVVNEKGQLTKDNEVFTITFMTASPDKRHLTLYQEDLKKVGIDVKIEQLSWATISKRTDEHNFDMYWAAYGASRLRDPESMWSSKEANVKASGNLVGLQDAKVDSLLKSYKTAGDAERTPILKELDARLVKLRPYVFLWQSPHNRILYWNKFGMPEAPYARFDREDAAVRYWWVSADAKAKLESARRNGTALETKPEHLKY